MNLTLCGATAFAYWRTPPQLLGMYPPLARPFEDSNHLKFAASPLICDVLGTPLHRVVTSQNQRRTSKLYVSYCIQSAFPFGSFCDTDHGFTVTSPAATLLTMAQSCSREALLMAAYEMTGDFAVFTPCKRAEEALEQNPGQRVAAGSVPWRRVQNVDGFGTDLWQRRPLLSMDELASFCKSADGFRGIQKLRWAAEHVTGETASPFEVQASMLLALPKTAGGEGYSLQNNVRIPLSPAARRIYPHNACYADILIEGQGDNAGVIVECQGRSVHASEAASILDSDRTTALASMGYEVILLTYEQIKDSKSFQVVCDIIARKAGAKLRPKTVRALQAQENLRQTIFGDWSLLGRQAPSRARLQRSSRRSP